MPRQSATPKPKYKRKPVKPRKILPWEQGLPPAPRKSEVLHGVVLDKISYFQPKQFHELYQEVVDDYGDVTDRTVHRHIEKLVKSRTIKMVRHDELLCYLRCGNWISKPAQDAIKEHRNELGIAA